VVVLLENTSMAIYVQIASVTAKLVLKIPPAKLATRDTLFNLNYVLLVLKAVKIVKVLRNAHHAQLIINLKTVYVRKALSLLGL